MSLSNSRLAYEEEYEVMDRALESAEGVRVGFDAQDDASYYRMRMNQARKLDRQFNGERYTNLNDPRRNKSQYDALSIRIRRIGNTYWVYVAKRQKPALIEEIKEEEGEKVRVREVITHRRF